MTQTAMIKTITSALSRSAGPALGIALAASALIATPASAHGDFGRYQDGWNQNGWAQNGGDSRLWQARQTCSGQQARALEFRLDRAVRMGAIAPRTAARIHASIDRLEDRAADECRERDWRGVEKVGFKYRDVSDWIAREAAQGRGYRDDRDYRDGPYNTGPDRWHQR